MAKSDARFEYRADLARTDHDLSQPFGFTCPPGMLSPIFEDIATPGDAYYMQHDLPLLRSSVLAAPSMVDVKVHFETFFVPFQMIYQPIETTLFSTNNLLSSSYVASRLQNANFPLMNYSSVIHQLRDQALRFSQLRSDAFRMFDFFGMRAKNVSSNVDVSDLDFYPNVFPWQILAYNCIYQHYYRLDDKEQLENDTYNWDYLYDTSDVTYDLLNMSMFYMKRRPWNMDYYNSLYRSPIVSSKNMQSILPSGVYQNLVNVSTNGISNAGFVTSTPSDVKTFSANAASNYDSQNVQLAISAASIRQMFANEKLAMITGRTRKNYDSQVLAHYGYNVPHDVKHDITMIHHDEYDLNVQEVTSLASTQDSPLGELAGKSYASGNGKQFKFVAPCHGIIMTIFSVEPKKRYFDTFDKQNVVTDAYDLPIPEFDRLGNQPMFNYESGLGTVGSRPTEIAGWKERYYQWKHRAPRCTWAFGYNSLIVPGEGVNTWTSYMLASRPYQNMDQQVISLQPRPWDNDSFLIDYSAMDNLCLVPYVFGWIMDEEGENWSRTPWLVYQRDPFIVDCHVKCKKVSWMSKDGEPVYNF